jgi:hypothetical protein
VKRKAKTRRRRSGNRVDDAPPSTDVEIVEAIPDLSNVPGLGVVALTAEQRAAAVLAKSREAEAFFAAVFERAFAAGRKKIRDELERARRQ